MSMTPQLYTISGLAVELRCDRRVIARKLSTVPPDGKVHAHKAWYLTTALEHQGPPSARNNAAAGSQSKLPIIEIMQERLDDWKPMSAARSKSEGWTFGEFADLMGLDHQTVLSWLRAGMPYQVQGNWKTGAGFVLLTSHCIDWLLLVSFAVHKVGAQNLKRQLSL